MNTHAAADPALDPVDPVALAEAWRAQGAAQGNPVQFSVIEALARRAAAQQGEARALLVRRMEALRVAMRVEHAAARPVSVAAAVAPTPADGTALHEPPMAPGALAGLAALSELVDRLGRSPASPMPLRVTPQPGAARPAETLSRTAAPPRPLKAVTAFNGTWSRLRVEHRLRQALAQVPASAGPLNSSHLVNRALLAMRDLSPEYLDAFMSHIDTLQWLEQASGAGDLTPRAAAPAEAKRRAGSRAGRKG